ncbi:MAG TPA: DUF4159 domain-containing protein [Vicinamibacterales bacterium]|jgi:hypothetical protein|nr:DUF4159 domain-containing protein [Vicinamibacterales bacterium]
MRRRTIAVLVPALLITSLAWAQFRRVGDTSLEAHLARPETYDGRYHYCRAVYRPNPRGDGGSWLTDYPLADIDLSIRVSELTKIAVSFEAPGQPNHLIVRLTDDELYQCPVIIMQEVGRLFFSADDAERLRTYLLKGGFLWVDDFWGSYAWQVWETEIRKVFPANDYPIVDIPTDHALFHTMFDLKGVPQIPGIGTWLGGRTTSERGADSAEVHARAIADPQGRVMVFMTHNTDVSDSWEREGEDPQYFYQFSIDGYRVAVNVLLYAMTH